MGNRKNLPDPVQKSVAWLEQRIHIRPSVAVILGSGLGDFARQLENARSFSASDIPYYPPPTVQGHKGALVLGNIGKKNVLVFQGRVHFYELGDLQKVLYPIYVAHGLGATVLVVTNAAGGINRLFQPGDLMVIADQINLSFENPLRSLRRSNKRDRQLYDPGLLSVIEEVGKTIEVHTRRGVYCGVKGPSYETGAEVQMIRKLGGDAVGMSTVNEVSLAATLGMRVGGISCITNLATGLTESALSHREVTIVAAQVKKGFESLLKGLIARL